MDFKEAFRYLITEFHESDFPQLKTRDFQYDKIGKIITLIGFRRSGKTFLLYQIINSLLENGIKLKNIIYINFEDDRILNLQIADLQQLLDAYYELYPELLKEQKYFFLDEVQVIDKWESFVRRIYDKEKISLFITGSSSKLLSKEIATSLRGRTLSYEIFPLSFKEYLDFKDIKTERNFEFSKKRFLLMKKLESYSVNGGFPEVVNNEDSKAIILQNYYDLFIYKDLVERYNIRNINALRSLAKYLLSNISNTFSVNKYSKSQPSHDTIARPTLMEYFSYLEEIFLIISLKMFSYSLKVQQVNPVKVYCIDTGLRNQVAFYFSKDLGRLMENIVCIELIRRKKEIFYWKGKNEVDFIIKERDNSLQAINVSYTDEISKREYVGLQEFKKEYSDKNVSLLLLSKDKMENNEEIIIEPLWKWLLT